MKASQGNQLSSSSLADVVFAQTRLSRVEREMDRLTYCGYDVRDLAQKTTFEEVAYLLWHGELPNRAQLAELKEQMAAGRQLPDHVRRIACDLPQDTEPLDALRTLLSALGVERSLVSALGAQSPKQPTPADAIALTAQVPVLIAAFDRIRRGLEPLAPRADLDTAASYLSLLSGQDPNPAQAKALDTYLVLLADQATSTSTFSARVVASTHSDLMSCVTAALGALHGPLHGGAASARVLDMLQAIGTRENAEPWMQAAVARGERLMGFGQHLFARTDPRAETLREAARAVSDPEMFERAQTVEETGERLLNTKSGQPLRVNVEFYSAVVLHGIGLPKDLFAATFAVGRIAGWTAHVLEQVANNRLVRPDMEYAGPDARPVPPLKERT